MPYIAETCGILVPQPKIKPVPPAVEAWTQALDHQGSPVHLKLIQWCISIISQKEKRNQTGQTSETL